MRGSTSLWNVGDPSISVFDARLFEGLLGRFLSMYNAFVSVLLVLGGMFSCSVVNVCRYYVGDDLYLFPEFFGRFESILGRDVLALLCVVRFRLPVVRCCGVKAGVRRGIRGGWFSIRCFFTLTWVYEFWILGGVDCHPDSYVFWKATFSLARGG